jgi:hypothetical protein
MPNTTPAFPSQGKNMNLDGGVCAQKTSSFRTTEITYFGIINDDQFSC